MLAYTLHTNLLLFAFLWLSALPPIKASQSFTNIYEHSSDSCKILVFCYPHPRRIPSFLKQSDSVAHIYITVGAPFLDIFFLCSKFIYKQKSHSLVLCSSVLPFCMSSPQSLKDDKRYQQKNEWSPGKRCALWQPCALKCCEVLWKACLFWSHCQKCHRMGSLPLEPQCPNIGIPT